MGSNRQAPVLRTAQLRWAVLPSGGCHGSSLKNFICMKKKYVKKLSAYKRINRVFDNHQAVLDTNTGLKTHHTTFDLMLTELKGFEVPERSSTIPITDDKNMQLETVAGKVFVEANALLLLAADQKNPAYAVDIPTNYTDLTAGPEVVQVQRFKKVHSAAKAAGAALETYGITPQSLASLDLLLPSLDAAVGSPRSGIDSRIMKREQMEDLFKEMDDFLDEKLDRAVNTVILSHGEFVRAYFQARKLYSDPAAGHELPPDNTALSTETPVNRMAGMPTTEELAHALMEVSATGTPASNGTS
jgi:hypothetical protein